MKCDFCDEDFDVELDEYEIFHPFNKHGDIYHICDECQYDFYEVAEYCDYCGRYVYTHNGLRINLRYDVGLPHGERMDGIACVKCLQDAWFKHGMKSFKDGDFFNDSDLINHGFFKYEYFFCRSKESYDRAEKAFKELRQRHKVIVSIEASGMGFEHHISLWIKDDKRIVIGLVHAFNKLRKLFDRFVVCHECGKILFNKYSYKYGNKHVCYDCVNDHADKWARCEWCGAVLKVGDDMYERDLYGDAVCFGCIAKGKPFIPENTNVVDMLFDKEMENTFPDQTLIEWVSNLMDNVIYCPCENWMRGCVERIGRQCGDCIRTRLWEIIQDDDDYLDEFISLMYQHIKSNLRLAKIWNEYHGDLDGDGDE